MTLECVYVWVAKIMGLTVFINLSINTASTEKINFSDEKNQYQYYNSEPITTRSKQHLLTHMQNHLY